MTIAGQQQSECIGERAILPATGYAMRADKRYRTLVHDLRIPSGILVAIASVNLAEAICNETNHETDYSDIPCIMSSYEYRALCCV